MNLLISEVDQNTSLLTVNRDDFSTLPYTHSHKLLLLDPKKYPVTLPNKIFKKKQTVGGTSCNFQFIYFKQYINKSLFSLQKVESTLILRVNNNKRP